MSEFVERLISMEISLNVRATVTHISPTVTHIYPHLEVITLEMDSDRPTELTIRRPRIPITPLKQIRYL